MAEKAAQVLIIDDDELFVASLSDFLSAKSYKVNSAKTGKEGLSAFDREQPTLVLLDQKLIDFLSFWEQFLVMLSQRTNKVTSIKNLQAGPHLIMGSPIAIQTVLIQLVENAVEGQENPRVELIVTSDAERIRIGVKDNGCGIKQKDLRKIFVPLFTTKAKRKGLGLSIALKLVAQRGGRLGIAPLAEGGTVAAIWLKRVGGENHGHAIHQ